MDNSQEINYMRYIIGILAKKLLEKNKKIGDYQINNVCGIGSNGIVLDVTSLKNGNKYALKILNVSYYIIKKFNLNKKIYKEELADNLNDIENNIRNRNYYLASGDKDVYKNIKSDEELNSFLREYNSLKTLKSNKYCVNLVDYGFLNNNDDYIFPYIVMPYFDGVKLTEYINKKTNSTTDLIDILNLIEKIIKIIKYIHSKKIMHRDLHLENFLYNEENEKIILIDFGTAIYNCDFSVDTVGEIRGSRRLMSPEQFKNPSETCYFSDYYFLGSNLFYMLTKQYPYSQNRKIETQPNDIMKYLNYKVFNQRDIYDKIVYLVNSLIAYNLLNRLKDLNEVEKIIFEIKSMLIKNKLDR